MSEIIRVLQAVETGDPKAAEELLPLVYEELRRLAAHRMANEAAGHTLQPTALVHEAWLRLAGPNQQQWHSRGHFFAAAAEAMRRILIDSARHRQALKRGNGLVAEELHESQLGLTGPSDEMLAIDEALGGLAREDETAANLVKLRYFAGMTLPEAATALEIPVRTAERLWAYARAWLRRSIEVARRR